MRANVAIAALTILLGGCISIGRDPRPDFPPAINASIYENRITETWKLAHDGKPAMSIGGARIAKGGIYVDLAVVNLPSEFDRKDSPAGLWLGDSLSDQDEPNMLIEIVAPDGKLVRLRPMQRPRMGGFIMPGTCILYARAPSYVVHVNDHPAYVDVCMWRTERQLKPGPYRMRLHPQPGSATDRTGRLAEYYSMDTDWHECNVELAPTNDM